MTDIKQGSNLLELTALIASSHVANNKLSAADLLFLIEAVYRSLSSLGSTEEPDAPPGPLKPAVPIKASVQPAYLICLEDGKKLKLLKRHLQVAYGLSPAAYRERWGLPLTYPMVAPDYSERRSQMAKQIGLGSRRRETDKRKAADVASPDKPAPAKSGKRGRPRGPAR